MKIIQYITLYISGILLLMVLTSYGTDQTNDEAAIKAAFIINFTKYVEWQNNSLNNSDSFKIGVLGDQQIFQSLKSLSSKKIKNKKMEIVAFNSIEDIQECHLLYVSHSMSLSQLKTSATSTKCRNALVIGDKKDALSNGAAINFVEVNNQLKFEMNIQNFNKNKLKVSSQLLQLATTVYE